MNEISALLFGSALLGAVAPLQWKQTDSTLGLCTEKCILWQLNYKQEEGKPYFHPLCLNDGTVLTALRPADHLWHRGLWWSWKYINGTNYWEENKTTGFSDGRTSLLGVVVTTNADHSARVEMSLAYHLPDKPPVMTEKRLLQMSAPDAQGNYFIDWTSSFAAGAEDIKLQRTTPKKFSGGYAGLSCRMAEAIKGWTYTSSEGVTTSKKTYGKPARWLDYSKEGGIAIFDHPGNLRHPTTWYPNEMPFFSPAILFQEPLTLPAQSSLTLRYRVYIHSCPMDKAALDEEWRKFAKP